MRTESSQEGSRGCFFTSWLRDFIPAKFSEFCFKILRVKVKMKPSGEYQISCSFTTPP